MNYWDEDWDEDGGDYDYAGSDFSCPDCGWEPPEEPYDDLGEPYPDGWWPQVSYRYWSYGTDSYKWTERHFCPHCQQEFELENGT
jgi:hypothetical protein